MVVFQKSICYVKIILFLNKLQRKDDIYTMITNLQDDKIIKLLELVC